MGDAISSGHRAGSAPLSGDHDHAGKVATPTARRGVAAPGVTLFVAALGFFIVTLDAFVANVALPAIRGELGGGVSGSQWVIDGYTLVFAALLLSAGALADRFGARQAFGAGVLLFTIASVACGLAPVFEVLIAGRLLQGAGAALMMPASLALIREAYPDAARRARAISVWSLGAGVASAAGPVVGGFLTDLNWRLIFNINLPVGILALALLWRVSPSPWRQARLDWAGQASAIVGVGALTFGLIEGGAVDFAEPLVIAALLLAPLGAIAFLLTQARGTAPMVPLTMFRSRAVATAVAGGFSFTVGFYGLVFLLSLYLQDLRGLSALETGLAFIPMTGLTMFVTLLAPRVAARLGPPLCIALGQLFMATGLLLISLAVGETPVILLSLLTLLLGLGSSLSVPTLTALIG